MGSETCAPIRTCSSFFSANSPYLGNSGMIGAWRSLSSNRWFLTRIVQDIQVSKSWVPPPILFPSAKQEDQGCSLPQFHTGNVFVGQAFQTWEGKIPPGTTGGGPKSQTALGTTQIREKYIAVTLLYPCPAPKSLATRAERQQARASGPPSLLVSSTTF